MRLLDPVLAAVERDAIEPRKELRLTFEGGKAAVGTDKHFLRHILCVIRAVQINGSQLVDAVPISIVEGIERLLRSLRRQGPAQLRVARSFCQIYCVCHRVRSPFLCG